LKLAARLFHLVDLDVETLRKPSTGLKHLPR